MSEELLSGLSVRCRRRWSPEEKLRMIEESAQPGESVSTVARKNGVAPSQLFQWRKLHHQGGQTAISNDEQVVSVSEAKRLEKRVRELERLLGRKTLENEILKEALDKTDQKKRHLPIWSREKGHIR